MDSASILSVLISVVLVFLLVKYVVSPIIKALIFIIIFLLVIYIIQHFFQFNLNRYFGPLATYLDITKWGINLNWLLNPLDYWLSQLLKFLHINYKK